MKRLSRIQVYGGKTLHGTITIQGSKNAALPMMAASLLHRGVSVLEVCPKISDVFCMEEILQSLGAVTWWKDHDLYRIVPERKEQKFPASIHAGCGHR